jgi:hypothetical protein
MNNLKSALARAVIAATIVILSGCAALEGPDSGDILASMSTSSQGGGE